MAGDNSQVTNIFAVSASALQAQDQRMKVIAENIANAGTTATSPGEKPYQRKVISFKDEFDRALGAYKVKVASITKDHSDFIKKFDPSNPAADPNGYVLTPNVNPITETMDMMEAQHSYQANLNVIDATRGMLLNTINLLNTQ
jgi:flagellar basal-body rod protein FlgC